MDKYIVSFIDICLFLFISVLFLVFRFVSLLNDLIAGTRHSYEIVPYLPNICSEKESFRVQGISGTGHLIHIRDWLFDPTYHLSCPRDSPVILNV